MEEKNEVKNEKGMSSTAVFVLAIIMFFIGAVPAFYFGMQYAKKEDNNKIKEKETMPEKEENEHQDNNKNIKGTLKSIDEEDYVNIKLNNKIEKLAVFNNTNSDKKSYLTFGSTNLYRRIFGSTGSYIEMPEVTYIVVNGNDNKEYLIVTYSFDFEHVLLVLNDETKIIGEYTNRVLVNQQDGYYCFATFNESSDSIFEINNDNIYYYKYKDGNILSNEVTFDDNSIELTQIKLDINNNSVEEKIVGTKKLGKFKMCS